MSNLSYFTDPGQEALLGQIGTQRVSEQAQFDALSNDPAIAFALQTYSQLYPQGSTELGLALASTGADMNDPGVGELVLQEMQMRPNQGPIETPGSSWGLTDPLGPVDDAVMGTVKGAFRWGFAAWDALYQFTGGGAPWRALQMSRNENIGFSEAWKEQDPYVFEALGGLIAGERVNLGPGFFANSDVSDDVRLGVNLGMQQLERDTADLPTGERTAARLEGSPDIWTQAVAGSAQQQEMGRPLTQLHDVQNESVMFTVGGHKTPWSPGRMIATTVTEPGTKPWHAISATGDLLSQIFLDPVDWVGGSWLKAGKESRRIWAVVDGIAQQMDKGKKASGVADEALDLGPEASAELARRAANAPPGPPQWYSEANYVNIERPVPKFKRQEDGSYVGEVVSDLDGNPQAYKIEKIKPGQWEAKDAFGNPVLNRAQDPRYEAGNPTFKTKKAAEEAVKEQLQGPHPVGAPGYTMDEFIDSGEEFFIDGVSGVPNPDGGLQKVYAGPEGGNGKIKVYGDSAYIDSRYVPEKIFDVATGETPLDPRTDPSLAYAYDQDVRKPVKKAKTVERREQRKIRDAAARGMARYARRQADEGLEFDYDEMVREINLSKAEVEQISRSVTPEETEAFQKILQWMDDNGVGKINIDGEWYVNPRYVGGNPADPPSQAFVGDVAKPMDTTDLGIETLESPTLNDLYPIFDMAGRRAASEEPGAKVLFSQIEVELDRLLGQSRKLMDEGGAERYLGPEGEPIKEAIQKLHKIKAYLNDVYMGGPKRDHEPEVIAWAKDLLARGNVDPRVVDVEDALRAELKQQREEIGEAMREAGYPEEGVDADIDNLRKEAQFTEAMLDSLMGEYYGGPPVGGRARQMLRQRLAFDGVEMEKGPELTVEVVARAKKLLEDELVSLGGRGRTPTESFGPFRKRQARISQIESTLEAIDTGTAAKIKKLMGTDVDEIHDILRSADAAPSPVRDLGDAVPPAPPPPPVVDEADVAFEGGPALFHGSKGQIPEGPLGQGGRSFANIFGPGLYTTASHKIGDSYAARGVAGEVSQMKWTGKGKPRILDMENPIPPKIVKFLKDWAKNPENSYLDEVTVETLEAFIAVLDDAASTGDEIYTALRRMLGTSESVEGVALGDEALQYINDVIGQDYDAFKHLGGKRTQARKPDADVLKHDVYVWLDPESITKVKTVSKFDPEKIADDVSADLGMKVTDGDASVAKRVVDTGNAEPTSPPVISGGTRPTVDPNYELGGKKADRFLDTLEAINATEKGSGALLDRALRFFAKGGVPVPNNVKRQILDAPNRDAIRDILVRWMYDEGSGVQEALLPGGTQYGRLGAGRQASSRAQAPRVSWRENRWMARQMARGLTGMDVNIIQEPTEAYHLYEEAIPHFKLQRGDSVQLYDDAGEAMVNGKGEPITMNVEEAFDRLRNMSKGDMKEGFEISGMFARIFFSTLVDEGVDHRLARRAAMWFRDNGEKAVYDAERFARHDLSNGPYDMSLIDGEMLGTGGIMQTSDMWAGNLQPVNSRFMKRVTGDTGRLGKISNRASGSWVFDDKLPGGVEFNERAVTRALDYSIGRIWKPFVLLRAAWTLRILMDDQARMVMDGYSMFSHPMRFFQYALLQPKEWRAAFAKGKFDINGVKFDIDELSNMDHMQYLSSALMRAHDPKLGPGAYGHLQHVPVGRGDPDYLKALAWETQHLKGSPIMVRMAQSEADDVVDDTVKWLQGKGPEGSQEAARIELGNQSHLHRKMDGVSEKIEALDYDTLHDVVSRQHAMLHHRLGGKVEVDNGKGQVLDWGSLGGVPGRGTDDGVAKINVVQSADDDLLQIVGTNAVIDDISYGGLKTQEQMDNLAKLFGSKVKQDAGRYPTRVRVPKKGAGAGMTDRSNSATLDRAVGGLMDWAMTRPSNAWSRIPEFRRAYWRKMGELYPYMDETLKAKVLEKAPMDIRRGLEKGKPDKSISGQLTDLDQADAHAKAFGLTMVEKTLFTLDSKSNMGDSLRLIMPFAEAWGEFITRWGRLALTGDSNIKTMNRIRQGVTSARRSGFFHENDYGQEVFSIPGVSTENQARLHNILNNFPVIGDDLLGGDVPIGMAEDVQATGSVESLNFASGVIPGFGPGFQVAAKALPDDPKWDWLRDLWSPFGTEGGVMGTAAPAWLKRAISAHGGANDPLLQYTYNSTTTDVIKWAIDAGEFEGLNSPQQINAKVAELEERAKGLLMVRAAHAFWSPASPQYQFNKSDEYGMAWSYTVLGNEFYKLSQKHEGDDYAAMQEFMDKFGFLPLAFQGGKTYRVIDRSRTESGSRYERSHPELFDQYPFIAMYLDPNIDIESEYDHSATLVQLKRGERESWTAEQQLYQKHDFIGDMMMDRVKKISQTIKDPSQRDAYIAERRAEISADYPYWNVPVPGRRQGVTNEQKIKEVQEALTDGRLAGTPVIEAAREYERARQNVLAQLATVGSSSIDGPKSDRTKAGRMATKIRDYLRKLAEDLELKTPEFGPMYRNIYHWEVSKDRDTPEPIGIDMYDEGDIFESLGI